MSELVKSKLNYAATRTALSNKHSSLEAMSEDALKTRLVTLRKKYLDAYGAVLNPPPTKAFGEVSSPVKGAMMRRQVPEANRKPFWKKLEQFRKKNWKVVGKWLLELDGFKEAQRLDHSNRKAPASAFKADADADKSRRAARREANRASLALSGRAMQRSRAAGTRASNAMAHHARSSAIREQIEALQLHTQLCQQLGIRDVDPDIPGDLKCLLSQLKELRNVKFDEDEEGAGSDDEHH